MLEIPGEAKGAGIRCGERKTHQKAQTRQHCQYNVDWDWAESHVRQQGLVVLLIQGGAKDL
eukprot:3724166-Rhodomonas_salina.1